MTIAHSIGKKNGDAARKNFFLPSKTVAKLRK